MKSVSKTSQDLMPLTVISREPPGWFTVGIFPVPSSNKGHLAIVKELDEKYGIGNWKETFPYDDTISDRNQVLENFKEVFQEFLQQNGVSEEGQRQTLQILAKNVHRIPLSRHEGEREIRDLNRDVLLVSETVLAAILSLKVPLVVPAGKRPFYSNFGDFENLIEWWAKNRRLQVKTVVLNKISPISVFIVAREDLGLGKGKLGAQVAHGLVAATLQPTQVNEYLSIFLKNRSPQFDIFTVSNEGTLASMLQLANRLSLNAALIADAGHTQIPRGTVTVLALGPAPRYYLERFIGEWNTVKRMNL